MVGVPDAPAAMAQRRRFLVPSASRSRVLHIVGASLMLAIMLSAFLSERVQLGSLQVAALREHLSLATFAYSRKNHNNHSVASSMPSGSSTSSSKGNGKKYSAQASGILTFADELEAARDVRHDGPQTAGLPCQESGYCSVGKLVPYVGEVDSTQGLRAAANASSYKKEVILLTIGGCCPLAVDASSSRAGHQHFYF